MALPGLLHSHPQPRPPPLLLLLPVDLLLPLLQQPSLQPLLPAVLPLWQPSSPCIY
jgi:hypothetical protein